MKKTLLLFVLFIVLAFGGCAPAASEPTQEADPTQEAVESVEPTATPEPTPEATQQYYFSDGVLVSRDVRIEIVDWRVVGPEDDQFIDGEELVFVFDTTNLSGNEAVSASSAWLAMFSAVQDNDPNFVNTLDVGSFYDEELIDNGFVTIKKDGTVRSYMSYILDDLTTPVTLTATRGLGGEFLGEQTFDIALAE